MNCKRLFYCLISLLFAVRLARAMSGPQTTTVSDTVYRGDSTPAAGTLVISWPEFSSSDGFAVAAGSMSLTIGAGGAVTVALVPNAGATPAGTYYKVVYQLSDAVAAHDVVDQAKFEDGLSKVIDGVVACLNASSWAKK